MNEAEGGERATALRPLLQLAHEAGSGEVSEGVDAQGRERLLAAMSRRAARPRWGSRLGVLAVAAAIAGAVVWARPDARLRWSVEGGAIAGDSGFVAPARGGSAALRFSDGSAIALSDGARARVAEVTARGARVVLEDGRAQVQIVHTKDAAWSIEAGPYTIAVTGTEFDVAWSAEAQALDVRMVDGAVVVRGREAPNGIALRAGQHLVAHADGSDLRIEATSAAATASAAVEAPPPSASASVVVARSASPSAAPAALPNERAPGSSASAAPPPTWAQRVGAGEFAGVIADAEARGIDGVLATASLADLAALADAARYGGRIDLARRALQAERARFAGSSQARAAAFLLGRIAEDTHGAPAEAIALYDQYLAEAPGGPLAAEALGRKMVALRKSGATGAAREVAVEYLRRHPDGAYAAAARELSRAP